MPFSIRQEIRDIGIGGTLYTVFLKLINRFVYFKILRGMVLSMDTVDPKNLKNDEKYTHQFLSKDALVEFSKHKEYELSEDFIQETLGKGDGCFGILEKDTLASYGWYSNRPTPISNDLTLHFLKDYIYMYKGFTHHQYRGLGLHAIGMSKALEAYSTRGFKGIVSYVESDNFRSLKSVYRTGYKDFGNVYILKIFGKYFISSSNGCQQYGFWVENQKTD